MRGIFQLVLLVVNPISLQGPECARQRLVAIDQCFARTPIAQENKKKKHAFGERLLNVTVENKRTDRMGDKFAI